jgi:phosphate transport system permease protein
MSTADSRYPPRAPGDGGPQPLRIRRVTPEDTLTLAGAAIGSLGLTWVLYERVLPFTGALGFWVGWYLAFLLLYIAAAALLWNWLVVKDKAMSVAVASGGVFATAVVVEQIGYSFVKGLPAISHWTFFTATMAFASPTSSLRVGGILHAAVGSLEQLGLATLFSVPLGVLAALFLAEVGGRMERPVRTIVNAMTALPSIVAGLFVYAFAVLTLGLPQSGLAAALAIAVVMLPTVTRAAEVVLRVVPGTLREASFALGASHWRTVWNVTLPTARSGLATAVVLAMARGIGETAPVLLTAGFTNELNVDPVHGWQATLPTFIITSVLDDGQFPNFIARAFGAGFTLMLIVLILFTIARLLGGGAPGELTRRQRRKVRRDAGRLDATPPRPDRDPSQALPLLFPDPQ